MIVVGTAAMVTVVVVSVDGTADVDDDVAALDVDFESPYSVRRLLRVCLLQPRTQVNEHQANVLMEKASLFGKAASFVGRMH